MGKKNEPKKGGFIKRWFFNEGGFSEVAGAIFVIPVMGFLIFALVESGINMNTRARVNSITQDTAMSIASDGALYWELTSPADLNSSRTWQTVGLESLQALCDGGGGSCDEENIRMVCTVEGSTSFGDNIQVAAQPGAEVVCEATVPYSAVSPLSGNPFTSMGLSGLFTGDIKSTARAQTVVGYEE